MTGKYFLQQACVGVQFFLKPAVFVQLHNGYDQGSQGDTACDPRRRSHVQGNLYQGAHCLGRCQAGG